MANNDQKTPWDYLKSHYCITWSAIERVKFAGGVVGKLTLIAVVAIVVIGAICFKVIAPNIGIGPMVIAGLGMFAVIVILGTAYFAIIRTTDRHPNLAAVEGGDLVTLLLGMEAKDTREIVPNQKPGPKPYTEVLPQIERGQRGQT